MLPEQYWILLKLSCWVCRLGGATGRVFISYSHADKLYAERVIRQLRSARFDVVVDQDALQAGQEWRTELFRLIRSSQAILVILTESARTSEEVASEWAYALGVGVPVFPLRFEMTSRPSRLDQLHGFDFRRHSAPWGDLIKTLNFLPPAPRQSHLPGGWRQRAFPVHLLLLRGSPHQAGGQEPLFREHQEQSCAGRPDHHR